MNHEQRMGGWTTFETQITKEEQQVFETATKELVGVGYKPVAVATQVVSGRNYRFFCNATPIIERPTHEAAIVQIYQPLDGEATITEIKNVE